MNTIETIIEETCSSVKRITMDDVDIQENKEKLLICLNKVKTAIEKKTFEDELNEFRDNWYPGIQSLLDNSIMSARARGNNLTPELKHNITLACELLILKFENMLCAA